MTAKLILWGLAIIGVITLALVFVSFKWGQGRYRDRVKRETDELVKRSIDESQSIARKVRNMSDSELDSEL